MKIALVTLAALLMVSHVFGADIYDNNNNDNNDDWQVYKKRFGKSYEDPKEDAERRQNFIKTKKRIEEHNKLDDSLILDLSDMSDWYEREIAMLTQTLSERKERPVLSEEEARRSWAADDEFFNEITSSAVEIPPEHDWRNYSNRVGPVKSQGNCSSCWAFATTGLLEGQQFKFNNLRELVPLSEQQLVDCSSHADRGNHGCGGGYVDTAIKVIISMGGIVSDASYPYEGFEGSKGECSINKTQIVMSVEGVKTTFYKDADRIKQIVASYGPVAVDMFGPSDVLNTKFTGVVTSKDCKKELMTKGRNHAVLIVGYGTDNKHGDYWIVKNSWGVESGEGGYFRIERGKNTCLIEEVQYIALL